MKTLPVVYSLILAVGASALCGEAIAGDPDAPRQQVVSFGDLNLDHPDGVKALFGRLSRAARAVCAQPSSGPYALWTKSRQCAQEALDNAIEDIDNANLTAYYNDRTGQPGQPGQPGKSGAKVASRR